MNHTNEGKPREVVLRYFKLLSSGEQNPSVATSEMMKYANEDVNYDYVKFIEYSAFESAQARIKELEANNNHLTFRLDKTNSDHVKKYAELEAQLEIAIEALKFECGNRCAEQNPCNAKEALSNLKGDL